MECALDPSLKPMVAPLPAPPAVLVLDDERVLAEMMGQMLRLMGCQPTICTEPTAALEAVREQEFHLIISDYRMPGMSGEEFYHLVVAHAPALASRVLFLTGDSVSEDARRFFSLTGAPYLDKPCPVSVIRANIRNLLQLDAKGG